MQSSAAPCSLTSRLSYDQSGSISSRVSRCCINVCRKGLHFRSFHSTFHLTHTLCFQRWYNITIRRLHPSFASHSPFSRMSHMVLLRTGQTLLLSFVCHHNHRLSRQTRRPVRNLLNAVLRLQRPVLTTSSQSDLA